MYSINATYGQPETTTRSRFQMLPRILVYVLSVESVQFSFVGNVALSFADNVVSLMSWATVQVQVTFAKIVLAFPSFYHKCLGIIFLVVRRLNFNSHASATRANDQKLQIVSGLVEMTAHNRSIAGTQTINFGDTHPSTAHQFVLIAARPMIEIIHALNIPMPFVTFEIRWKQWTKYNKIN